MKDEIICIMLSTQSLFFEKVLAQEQRRVIQIERLSKMIDQLIKKNIRYGER